MAPLMPQVSGRSRPFRDHRQVVEGIIFRYRCGVRGGTCLSASARGRRCGSGIAGSVVMGPGTGSSPWCLPRPTRPVTSTGRSAWTQRSTGRISTPPPFPAAQGAGANHMNQELEPPDHAVGRSRGGLSTKIHHAVDGKGRPLAVLVGPGQGGDAPMCLPLLNAIRVPRLGAGRPRTRPDALLADKAYSSRAIRSELRRRGIVAVIPEPRDQQGHRKRRG